MAGEIEYDIPPLTAQGPQYATEVNAALAAIATHTHDGANAGASIDIGAQVCNEDLSVESHNVTNVRSVELNNNPSQLTGSQDVNCLYVNQNNLGFNNSDGVFVPITSGNTLAITSLAFTNLTPRSATITSNFAILYTDPYNLININSSGGAITGTLPIAAQITPTAAGRLYIFRDVGLAAGTNSITIQVAPASGNTFADSAATSFVINNNGGYFVVYTDGVSKWFVWGQNVYNGEVLQLNNSGLNLKNTVTSMTSGATILGDNTAAIELAGALIMATGSGAAFEGNATCAFVGTSVLSFATGTSCTLASGSSCTYASGSTLSINGALNGSTTGGTLQVAGEIDVTGASSGLFSTQQTTLSGTTTMSGTTNVSGTTTVTGTVSITGGSTSSVALGPSSTIANQGLTSLYGTVNALTPYNVTTFSYACDSSGYLDSVIGIIGSVGGNTGSVVLPASPPTGRTITIMDISGADITSASGYGVQISGNGHNVSNFNSNTGTAGTQAIASTNLSGSGSTLMAHAWWSITLMFVQYSGGGPGVWAPIHQSNLTV